MRKGLVGILGLIFLVGCSKEPGVGGKNSIEGVIIIEEYIDGTELFVVDILLRKSVSTLFTETMPIMQMKLEPIMMVLFVLNICIKEITLFLSILNA